MCVGACVCVIAGVGVFMNYICVWSGQHSLCVSTCLGIRVFMKSMCVCVCLFECVCVSFLCFKTPHLSLSLPFSMLFPLHLNCLSNFLSLEGLCVSVFSKQRPCLTDEVLGGIDPLN